MSDARGGRVSAREAVATLTGSFTEHRPPERPGPADGPLGWSGYADSRARAAARTGEDESVLYGVATVEGLPCVLVSFEFGFLGARWAGVPGTGWRPRTRSPVSGASPSSRSSRPGAAGCRRA